MTRSQSHRRPRNPRLPLPQIEKDRLVTAVLILLGVILRSTPHPQNITPVGGITLFAGTRLRGVQACLVPLLILFITDLIASLGRGFPTFTTVTPFVYGSLLVSVWIGGRVRTTRRLSILGIASILASVQFFLVSNFGLWLSGISFFSPTVQGLADCYVAGLPYLGRTILGDGLYFSLFWGLHSWAVQHSLRAGQVTA